MASFYRNAPDWMSAATADEAAEAVKKAWTFNDRISSDCYPETNDAGDIRGFAGTDRSPNLSLLGEFLQVARECGITDLGMEADDPSELPLLEAYADVYADGIAPQDHGRPEVSGGLNRRRVDWWIAQAPYDRFIEKYGRHCEDDDFGPDGLLTDKTCYSDYGIPEVR